MHARGALRAILRASSGSGATEVRWSTVEEHGSIAFAVERAPDREGTFVEMAIVAANGSGSDYRVLDESGKPAWHRVVEYTAEGRGDETPAFTRK